MKSCSKCKIEQPIDGFYKDSSRKDSYSSSCKMCQRAWQSEYRAKNPEKTKAAMKLWRSNNKDHTVEMDHKRYWSNPEAARISAKERYYKDVEHSKAVQREYRQRCPDVLRERNRRRRAVVLGLSEHFTEIEWIGLLNQYGSKCMNPICGAVENLTRDHIIPLIKGGTDSIENIQILCARCNSSKHTTVVDYKSCIII